MSRAFPKEFRRDVVAVARKRESTQEQIAKDFGISHATLSNWMRAADAEDGVQKHTAKETNNDESLRAANKRIRLLEQENEILRRAAAYFSRDALPK
jgi:transposase